MSDHQRDIMEALRKALEGQHAVGADAVIREVSAHNEQPAEDVVYVLAQAVADGVVEVDRDQRLSLARQPAAT